MKKFITRSLFAFVIMGFSLVSVNAATKFTYEGWTAGSGYGTKNEVNSNITNLMGEETANGGMYYGPFNKQSTQALEDGIIEETHVDLDFEAMVAPEFFEVSLALNDANGVYLDEAVVMTQLVEEGKFKLTAGWAPEFEAVVTEDGVYTYQWEVYIENEKAYVKFNLVDNGEVVATTGAIEFAKLNAEGVTVRYLWFCNINVAEGVNVYSRLPELTVETDTGSDLITVVDSEKAEATLVKAVKTDEVFKRLVERFDTVVAIVAYEPAEEDIEDMDDEEKALFEDEIKDDKIVKYFANMVGVGDENSADILWNYQEKIEYKLVLPEDLPAVAKGYERKYYIIEIVVEDEIDEEYEVQTLETTLAKDGKSLTFATDNSGIYALSYVDSVLPPKTGDNVTIYVILGIVSMLGLAVIAVKGKKIFN